MGNRKRRGLEPWARNDEAGRYAPVAYSLNRSAAFKALTGAQIRLYLFVVERRQYTIYLNAKGNGTAETSPAARWCDAKEVTPDCFFLNRALATAAGYYRESDSKAFYRDMNALKKYGFIDTVIDGKRCSPRGKSVYRMSERWKAYTRPRSPPEIRT